MRRAALWGGAALAMGIGLAAAAPAGWFAAQWWEQSGKSAGPQQAAPAAPRTDTALRRAAGTNGKQEAPPAASAAPAPPASGAGGLQGMVAGLFQKLAPAPERFTVLLLGSDRRPTSRSSGGNADTMVLATLDPAGQTIGLLSIPRDLWVPIRLPNGSMEEQRLNAAYGYGGAALAKSTVEDLFGVTIHRTVSVELGAFPGLVDALGGVEVNPPKTLDEVFLPLRPGDSSVRAYFPAGPQHLNGEQALMYARMRHQDSDIGRMARQQEVLLGLRRQALRPQTLFLLPELWTRVQSSLRTDLGLPDLLRLAGAAVATPQESVSSTVLGWAHVKPVTTEQGWQVLEPNWPAIRAAVGQMFYDVRARAAVGRVEIVNRSGVAGLGQQAAAALRRQGVREVTVRDEAPKLPQGAVQAAPDRTAAAQEAARLLGLPATPARGGSGAVTVVLGAAQQRAAWAAPAGR